MNWQIIGPIGYLSIILSGAALASWLLYWIKPRRMLANAGLLLALAAFFCAQIHSNSYVGRIAVDPAAKLAEIEARKKAQEQALINSRSDEVAQIRFAEDSQSEFLDTAGLDETDLKYMQAITESETETPDWKKTTKVRGSSAEEDGSLESMIGAKETTDGADVAELEPKVKAEPILLDEASVVLANKLDLWNLQLSDILLWMALAILIADYLRRANLYNEASVPLPLPSAYLNAFTLLPVIRNRSQNPRRPMPEELKWLTRRGDSFIYFCDQPDKTGERVNSLNQLKRWPYRLDVLLVGEDATLSDEFIFEALWYGRCSFIVDSPDKAPQLLEQCIARLKKRRETKAKTTQTVHLVWDLRMPLSEETLEAFRKYAGPAGYSLFINSSPPA